MMRISLIFTEEPLKKFFSVLSVKSVYKKILKENHAK